MHLLAVDLAAKFSACCLMSGSGTVIDQWDSWQRTEHEFVSSIVDTFLWDRELKAVIVEDLPIGVQHMTTTKQVCQIQGRIADRMELYEHIDKLYFVAPRAWRASYDGMGRGTGPDVVVPVAEKFGYTPPDLTERATGKGDKARARKVQTDYCAAFLIARYMVDGYHMTGGFEIDGVSKYRQDP